MQRQICLYALCCVILFWILHEWHITVDVRLAKTCFFVNNVNANILYKLSDEISTWKDGSGPDSAFYDAHLQLNNNTSWFNIFRAKYSSWFCQNVVKISYFSLTYYHQTWCLQQNIIFESIFGQFQSEISTLVDKRSKLWHRPHLSIIILSSVIL